MAIKTFFLTSYYSAKQECLFFAKWILIKLTKFSFLILENLTSDIMKRFLNLKHGLKLSLLMTFDTEYSIFIDKK